VVINGELIIEHGANVQFLGKIEVVETSTEEMVEAAKIKLQKINEE
jgi:hypothetical protein